MNKKEHKEYQHRWYLEHDGKNRKRLPPRVEIECAECGKLILVKPSVIKSRENVFCSKDCYSKWQSKHQRGNKHNSWKGGRYYQGEYVLVRLEPDSFFYPMVKKSGYVLEHRLVVAKALNRCLLPWETVHHKEGFAKDDNRYPEVLQLLPNPHKHDALTKMTNYIRKLEKRIEELENEEENSS